MEEINLLEVFEYFKNKLVWIIASILVALVIGNIFTIATRVPMYRSNTTILLVAQEYNKNKKLKDDPRVTKIGKLIRKLSIDEFPQFINVFLGEMSLIGNRPYLPREKQDMGNYYEDIIKTKPGLTGYWQVSGRSNTSFDERLKLEKEYSDEAGLKLDIKIFFKTFAVVLFGKGAK